MEDDENGDNEICNTRLRLGIGGLDDDDDHHHHHHQKQKKISSKRVMSLELSFPNFHDIKDDHEEEKREKQMMEEEEEERQSITSNNLNNANGDDNNNNNSSNGGGRSSARKKLRLTQEQSTVLEGSFKLHTTLNTAQKQALSEKLNLKPRQVEVWFQNRRARTKLKQTEFDCEFLKKYCENLRDENSKLKKELQELRSSSSSSSSLISFQENLSKLQNSPTVLCPSCDQKMVNGSTTTSSDADDAVAVPEHPKPLLLPDAGGFIFFSNHK